jgi:molybdopterin adenylyltransferase
MRSEAVSTVTLPHVRAAVLTVSTSLARGEGEDVSGPALVELCRRAGLEVTHETVTDDRDAISSSLRRLADDEGVRFVFTTGGTGMTPDDLTPEATLDVIDRQAPGYAETIRAESRGHTPLGILTRGIAGIRGRTLIVNLPGNPKAIEQSWPVVEPTLEHAAETLERG